MKDIPDVDFRHRAKSVTGVIIKGYDKARKGLKKLKRKKIMMDERLSPFNLPLVRITSKKIVLLF